LLPHTDQQALLVNELMTSHIVELPEDEGEALLQELFSRLYAEENASTHVCQTDDVIIWDNLALQHSRPLDVGCGTRHLRRQSLDGWRREDGTTLDGRETARFHVVSAESQAGM
jgi:taurine dioxygenase